MRISDPFVFGRFRLRVAIVEPHELAPPNYRFSHYTRMLTEVWVELLGPADAVAGAALDAAIATEFAAHPQPSIWAGAR